MDDLMNALEGIDGVNTEISNMMPPPQPVQVPVQPVQAQPQQIPVQPVPPVQPVQAQPVYVAPPQTVTAPVPPVQPQQVAYAAPVMDLNKADETADEYAVFDLKQGEKISLLPIEKFKGVKGQQKRIGILSTDLFGCKVHYDDDLKMSFLCFNKECCTTSNPSVRYCYPVIEYSVLPDDAYSLIPGKKGVLKLLVLGGEAYDTIAGIIKAKGGVVDNFDLVVNCTDEVYNKCSYISTDGSFRTQIPNLNDLRVEWSNKRSEAYKAVGRKLPRDQYLQMKGLGNYAYSGEAVGSNAPSTADLGL